MALSHHHLTCCEKSPFEPVDFLGISELYTGLDQL
jgi:hypothetical protein